MRFVIVLVALAAACSTKKPLVAMQIPSHGAVASLRIVATSLLFCDAQGPHRVNLDTGALSMDTSTCSTEEPNTACAGLKMDVSVRSPFSEPNDIVDLVGHSFPLQGRVHDCHENGNRLAIVTGSSVQWIDAALNTIKAVSSQGGERVAVGESWIAWTDNSSIHVSPIR